MAGPGAGSVAGRPISRPNSSRTVRQNMYHNRYVVKIKGLLHKGGKIDFCGEYFLIVSSARPFLNLVKFLT